MDHGILEEHEVHLRLGLVVLSHLFFENPTEVGEGVDTNISLIEAFVHGDKAGVHFGVVGGEIAGVFSKTLDECLSEVVLELQDVFLIDEAVFDHTFGLMGEEGLHFVQAVLVVGVLGQHDPFADL